MIALSAGESSLVLAPEAGGAILGWRIGRDPLLRRADPTAMLGARARGMGAFPLVPFSNRISGGGFDFAGRHYPIARADPAFPTPIHGLGWVRRWDPIAVSGWAARLRLEHPARAADLALWPFAYTAELAFDLSADALRIGMRLVNRHAGPAPAGLGLHPYFPRLPGSRLQFRATGTWRATPERLPIALGPVPPAWDHAAGLPVGAAALDDVFAGWDGTAEIGLGARVVTLTASAIFRHLVVFTPPGADFFCVEPVSHATDAVNRPEPASVTGLAVLVPGVALEGELVLRVAAG